MRLKYYLTLCVLLWSLGGNAQNILQWNTYGNTGNEATEPSVYNNPNIQPANLTKGSGVGTANNNHRFGGNNWTTSTSIDANDYIAFTVNANAGYQFTPTSFEFLWESSSTGPQRLALRSSLDGYAANIASPVAVGGSLQTVNIPISGIVNQTSVTFRLYGYNAGANNGTGGIDANSDNINVTLQGTVIPTTPMPEIHVVGGTAFDQNIFSGDITPITADGTLFPNTASGSSSAPHTFRIRNLGTLPLDITSISLDVATHFSVTGGPTSIAPGNFYDFQVAFTPTLTGLRETLVRILSNDADENPYTFRVRGQSVTPAPEIHVLGGTSLTQNINSGDTSPSGLKGTQFSATNVGTYHTGGPRTFRILNEGTANLNITSITTIGAAAADFEIVGVAPSVIAPGNYLDFTLAFRPLYVGLREAQVRIVNNDSNENPYLFAVSGTGSCPVYTTTLRPQSGPEGTFVRIVSGNVEDAVVTFGGVPATVVEQVSATVVIAQVPPGAQTGSLVVTNTYGCAAVAPFTVIDTEVVGCPSGSGPSTFLPDLVISEIADVNQGGLTYVEIYNGTGSPVYLPDYTIRSANNGGAYTFSLLLTGAGLPGALLPHNQVYIVALGLTGFQCAEPGVNAPAAAQSSSNGGVNFNTDDHDHIGLFNGSTLVDSWGVFGDDNWGPPGFTGNGFRFTRNVSASALPSATYIASDWTAENFLTGCSANDFSNIGTYDYAPGVPPEITTHPVFTPDCRNITLSVAAIEGVSGGPGLTYQWYAVAPLTATWTALSDGALYSGTQSADLTILNPLSLEGYQFYVQVREDGSDCYAASNAVQLTGVAAVTWNGSVWTPAAGPSGNSTVVLNGNYNTATHGSFSACSVSVSNNRTLTIAPDTYVEIKFDLTVAATASILVQNNGSLVMTDDTGVVSTTGTQQLTRATTPFYKFDYTYWSSPVAAATIAGTFTGWRTDYAFWFNTSNFADLTGPNGTGPADGFDDDGNVWTNHTGAMNPGQGYAIMGQTNAATYPISPSVTFSGRFNNGPILVPISLSGNAAANDDDYNLLGNPYPSAISADAFINTNTNTAGTLYFWTHKTPMSESHPGPAQYNFISSDYAMYNLSGGVASANGGAVPTGNIASGQGFFVDAEASGSVLFNNEMRATTALNNNFYRQASSRERIWLRMSHLSGWSSQQLVAFTPEATNGYDRGYDGRVNTTDNILSFYSLIDQAPYRIQGRRGFDSYDEVPLGYTTAFGATFKISVDNLQGNSLAHPDQPVFIEDLQLGTMHNLKLGPYEFSTSDGVFNDRFVLKFAGTALGTPKTEVRDVMIVAAHQQVHIQSGEKMASVLVYDVLGRLLLEQRGLSHTEYVSETLPITKGLAVVYVTFLDGTTVIKKVML